MAVRKLETISVPVHLVEDELHRWKDDDAEPRNIAFLKAICQAYQDKVLEYYKSGATSEDRLARLEDVCQVFREIAFTSDGQTFTIAAGVFTVTPGDASELARGAGCPVGTQCINGVCAPEAPAPEEPGNN